MNISNRDFKKVAASAARKREAPFSLRFSCEEEAALKQAANGVPVGAYIKAVLFKAGWRRSAAATQIR